MNRWMTVMSPIATLFAFFQALCVWLAVPVLCLWPAVASAGAETNPLTVHIRLTFDRSISAKLIRTWMREEATALWEPHGVQIIWSDSEVDAAFHLDVIIARRQVGMEPDHEESALGLTTIDRSGRLHGPIRILSDTIESMMGQRHTVPVLQQRELARALGRVLAHELGHVLLGAPHDSDGLMRARISTTDLAASSRRTLGLSVSAVGRLREQIECLSAAGDRSACLRRGNEAIKSGEMR
jgi:hypothetical protein